MSTLVTDPQKVPTEDGDAVRIDQIDEGAALLGVLCRYLSVDRCRSACVCDSHFVFLLFILGVVIFQTGSNVLTWLIHPQFYGVLAPGGFAFPKAERVSLFRDTPPYFQPPAQSRRVRLY